MLGDRITVLLITADMQDAAVHFRMECFHAPVKHLGEARELRDVFHWNARIAQQLRRAAGRYELNAKRSKRVGKFDDPTLVGDAQNCSLNPGALLRVAGGS